MIIRFTKLLSGVALATLSLPAAAQDEVALEEIELDIPSQVIVDDSIYANDHHGGAQHSTDAYIAPQHVSLPASPDGRLGYTMLEREAWLADCRLLMADAGGYYDGYYEEENDGGLVGGLIGLIGGGFAGNRIADGDRLLGTVIGAGIGGLAGAVIGAAIDGDSDVYEPGEVDANELWAARYCDAYLRRYELAGTAGFYGEPAYGHSAMTRHQFPLASSHRRSGHRHGPECTTMVREEWVAVEAEPETVPARRTIAPRPRIDGKTVPID